MNKKVPGIKHGLAVDVMGLVIAVVVMAASVHDNAFGVNLLDKVAQVGTNGTLMIDRRLARCYEADPAAAESRVYWAITRHMTRRITGDATPVWRGA